MPLADPGPLIHELAAALPERPFRVTFWDGTELPATTSADNGGGPVFAVRSPRAVGHALRAPGQLGIGRAYVAGDLEVDDLDRLIDLLETWEPPRLTGAARSRLALGALRAAGIQRPPAPPRAELAPRGKRHSIGRDARAVRHHYDLPAAFFALFLDTSMTYSCAVWSDDPDETLEVAQERKLELVCTKLGLAPGMRVLDVGCGWGSFATHAAARHGVSVVGITLSAPQAERARRRAAEAGVSDRVEIRVADYRELADEPFDAVASIGMVEHVGEASIDAYAETLARMVRPGGRILNHGIALLRHGDEGAGPFSERYVFPDAEPLHLSRVLYAFERAGMQTEGIEGFREHYDRTLGQWSARLDAHQEQALELAGAERLRVWRLYLRSAQSGFRTGFTSIYQVKLVRPR
ncbi:MAG: cyclopropane-fatty-acyl-phospholipid synthase [Solirubrobacteraceae bacterium]|jgi:cyclopropane-fatty-acyl-phospholipid synthase|nr:cyclopropane-fatty-acyl-phospholipid synthase [Solirubrobacteraceae bacterium]